MKVLDGHSVLVEDDKITGIVKGNTVPDGFKEINLEGCLLYTSILYQFRKGIHLQLME